MLHYQKTEKKDDRSSGSKVAGLRIGIAGCKFVRGTDPFLHLPTTHFNIGQCSMLAVLDQAEWVMGKCKNGSDEHANQHARIRETAAWQKDSA